jgi:hypothetical protein
VEVGLTEIFLGVTAASLLPHALIAGLQMLWRTIIAKHD